MRSALPPACRPVEVPSARQERRQVLARVPGASVSLAASPPGEGRFVPVFMSPGARYSMRSAIRSTSEGSRLDRSASTRSRPIPSQGAEDQTRSRSSRPGPMIGSTAISACAQRAQRGDPLRARQTEHTACAPGLSLALAMSDSQGSVEPRDRPATRCGPSAAQGGRQHRTRPDHRPQIGAGKVRKQ